MLRKVTIILSCVLVVNAIGCKTNAGESQHQDLIKAWNTGQGTGPNRLPKNVPQKGMVTLKSGRYKLVINPQSAYTIGETRYDDKLIATTSGAQGTVILTEKGKESIRIKGFKGDPWIGTGHGGEIIHKVTCTVDGKEVPLTTDKEITGKRIVLEKINTQYKFKGKATTVMTPEGIEECQELVALEDFDDLHYTYFFMHPWVKTTMYWLTGYHDGSEDSGDFKGSQKINLSKPKYKLQPQWFGIYDPTLKIGILQFNPKPIPGGVFVNVANNYNKHYTMLPVKDRAFKKGEVVKYKTYVKVIEDETGNWEATRKVVAELKKAYSKEKP